MLEISKRTKTLLIAVDSFQLKLGQCNCSQSVSQENSSEIMPVEVDTIAL
jgi:hypothetical protein